MGEGRNALILERRRRKDPRHRGSLHCSVRLSVCLRGHRETAYGPALCPIVTEPDSRYLGRRTTLLRTSLGLRFFVVFLAIAPWYASAQSQASLRPGIVQTRQALQQVEQLLFQNQADLSKRFAGWGIDVLEKLGGVDAIGKIKNAYTTGEFLKALNDRDSAAGSDGRFQAHRRFLG